MDSNKTLQRILILDDDGEYRKLLLNWLGNLFPGVLGIEYDPRRQGVPAPNSDWSAFDVLLLDYELRLKDTTGLDILSANVNNRQFPATIMLTSAGSEEVAIRAFKFGVTDYLRKDWLSKEQLKSAVDEAFAHHLADRERLYTLEEVQHAAQTESKKAIDELKTKFEQARQQERERLNLEWQKFKTELDKNQQLLASIEEDRKKSEQEKKKLITEIEKLKAGTKTSTADAGINDQLETTQHQLDQTHDDIKEIKQNIEQVEANVVKAEWKQEQATVSQQKLEEDLTSFLQEFEQQEKQMAETHAKVIEKVQKSKEMAREKTAKIKVKNQKLMGEITTQVTRKKIDD